MNTLRKVFENELVRAVAAVTIGGAALIGCANESKPQSHSAPIVLNLDLSHLTPETPPANRDSRAPIVLSVVPSTESPVSLPNR